MEKKIPKVFANKVEKKAGHNKEVFYSSKEDNNEDVRETGIPTIKKEKNINQKIKEIFTSPRYVYKADVEIVLKNGTVKKRIVGKNGNYIITIENELIPIADIVDIKYQ